MSGWDCDPSHDLAKVENLPDWQRWGTVLPMTDQLGLRERKKLATREALSHAAWRLMVQRGLDAVTPEAIAEAAQVSPRTFRNYFASREEAIIDGLIQSGRATITDDIRAR